LCERQIIAEAVLTVDELLCQLAAIDIVISPLFHNLVLASKNPSTVDDAR
jgi:hypothetical protein